jgi:hypothetical protein
MKANYYELKKRKSYAGIIFDEMGEEIDEHERGLDSECPCDGYENFHDWLFLPHEQGQKQYLLCIKCMETSHT